MIFHHTFKKFNIFKINAFRRIFQQYLLIIFGLLTVLFFVFHSFVLNIKQEKKSILSNNYVTLKTEVIKEQNIVDTLTTELFIQQPDLEDLNNFLRLNYAEYFEYKTDQYMNSNSSNYFGTLTFIKKKFYSYPNFSKIIFHNTDTQSLTIFSNDETVFLERRTLSLPDKVLTTEEIKELILNTEDSGLISFHKSLNSPSTLDHVADMYYIFDNKEIYEKLSEKNKNSAGELFLIEANQQLYSSALFPITGALTTAQQDNLSPTYTVKSQYSSKKIWKSIIHLYFYFFIIAFTIVLISLPFITHHLRNLETKIVVISQKMLAIQSGKFHSSETPKETLPNDEFGLILDGLEKMSNQLKRYIDDVYVSEIKQKNYQMKTLRSQINPHFLYNTLEAIRMKAIVNQDFSVSEMLYNTSRLYKNMIKGRELITLNEELGFCDSYLRLFELRFEDNLFYDIVFDPELGLAQIEKLSIQPLIENYVIHGIDPQKNNNFIEIICEQKETDVLIQIKDNGKGIPPKKLLIIQGQLENSDIESSDSMGLLNVNYRIKERFGKSYGITIEENDWLGTTVFLRIPFKKEVQNE